MWPNPQFSVVLGTFTEKILNQKLHFLHSFFFFSCDYGAVNWIRKISGSQKMGVVVLNIKNISESNNVRSLYSIRKRNLSQLMVAHLNINTLRIKFDSLAQKMTCTVDILMISETIVIRNDEIVWNGRIVDIFGSTWNIWGSRTEDTLKQRKMVAFVRNCLVKMTLKQF